MSISNEQLLAFIKRNPVSITCAVLSLALGAAIYFRSGAIPAERALLEQKSAEGERLAINIKYGNQLKEQLDELTAASRAIDARLLPSQLGIKQQYFYKLEADTGVKLVSLSPGGPSPTQVKNFVTVPFGVSVQGTYPQIIDFLRRVENGPHYSRVLSAMVGKTGADTVALSLNLEILGAP
jgi:hypothetical protein